MRTNQTRLAGVCLGVLTMAVAGCTFTQVPVATPTTIPITNTAEPTTTPPPTVTLSPEPMTDTPEPAILPTSTPLPPTPTDTPTATPGPFEHEIQSGETLGFIIQQYGHRSFDVISEVVRINENIPNADTLPGAGNVILIPRPTEVTLAAEGEGDGNEPAGDGGGEPQQVSLAEQLSGAPTTAHIVQEGESLIDISQQYSTTLEIISQLNPDIPFFGCNFNIPSGGPDCNIILQVGQEVLVPAPTPTPTLSPTPSGNETATPTPTYVAPMVVFPPNGGVAQPGQLSLQWVSAGVLRPDEVYLVYVKNVTAETPVNAFITRSTTYDLPTELIPPDGEKHQFEWWVSVGKQNEQGLYQDISGQPRVYRFEWQG